jgi:site-specific recombinase XerD
MQSSKKWELTRDKYMSLDEVRRLRRTSEDRALADLAKGRTSAVRAWAVVDLALSTGLRVSEIAEIKTSDLTLNGPEPQLAVRNGKGGKPRTVTLPQDLKRHLREFLAWKKRLKEPTRPEDYLFVSERGKKFTTRGLQLLFKRAAEKAGLPPHFSIHACRHSYGTYLYQKTKDLRLVQDQLGHSTPVVTQVYSHITPEERVRSVNGLWNQERCPPDNGQ